MNGHLYLIGLRGTGKSTIGPILAQRLNRQFVDVDIELEHRAGRTIREIFEQDGEQHFRDLEEALLRELSEQQAAVIATGGGVVLREANRQRLRATGRIFWLTASTETMWWRMTEDQSTASRRPNLGVGGRAEVEALAQQREALYRQCADVIVDTEGRSPREIAEDILVACSTSSPTTS